jgi:hypothetical protein
VGRRGGVRQFDSVVAFRTPVSLERAGRLDNQEVVNA